ncbi:MAG: phosphatidylserine decarboxylase family protein [Bacteroidota bacterium]
MTIHKEGWGILSGLTLVLVVIYFTVSQSFPGATPFVLAASGIIFLLVLQFFRNPNRQLAATNDQVIYAPADGKVVVIEETEEPEFFNDRRIQLSIFMSPTNVHVNRNPISGKIAYYKYHPGKYLVAWHPKSSIENERTTIVYDNGKAQVLVRQIAGAVARRIRNYLKEGQQVTQGGEMGFIKFGSRVDLFLPLGTEIKVEKDQKVVGNRTVLATFST